MSKHHHHHQHHQQNPHQFISANTPNGLESFPLVRANSLDLLNSPTATDHGANQLITLVIDPSLKNEKKSLLVVKTNDTTTSSTTTKKEKKVVVKSIENLDQANVRNKPTDVVSITTVSDSSESDSSTSSTTSIDKCFCFSYSYVVLVGSFFAYMLASLLSTCFGVFFENMETDLNWSKSQVAFIGGLISALQDLTGPISSALTNRFGCRKTAFFGGLIASLGMIGAGYVQEFWLVGFLMGGVAGFGSSLVLVSSVVVVTYYFEEKPSFAAGLTISGGSLGQSIFSLIIIKLNELYGRSGCFLILGGILLNILVCAVLFRPLKWELEDEDEEEDDDEEEEEDDNEEDDEVEHSKNTTSNNHKNLSIDKKTNVLTVENSINNSKASNNIKLKAPIAKFDSHSAFSLNDSRARVPGSVDQSSRQDEWANRHLSTSYLMNNDFLSDYYLPKTSSSTAGEDAIGGHSIQRHASEGDLPINPSIVSLANMNPDDETETLRTKGLLFANSINSFGRCHSLDLTPNSEHQDSIIKGGKNQSVPASLKSSRVFRSTRSLSKSTLTLPKNLALHSAEVVAGDDVVGEQVLEEGGEYVVVAAADEIEKCGSNLIISPESDIYLPDIFNENDKNMPDSNNIPDDVPAIDECDQMELIETTIVNEKEVFNDQNVENISLKINQADEKSLSKNSPQKIKNQVFKSLTTENSHTIDPTDKNQKDPKTLGQSSGIISNFLKRIRTSSRSKPIENNEASKNPFLATKTPPILSNETSKLSTLPSSVTNKSNQATSLLGGMTSAVTAMTSAATGGQKTTAVGVNTTNTNRKIVVNAGQRVIRLDNNLYLIKNPIATGKGSGNFQKPTQKNFIIAKCTCKQRYAAQNAINKANNTLAATSTVLVATRKSKTSSSSTGQEQTPNQVETITNEQKQQQQVTSSQTHGNKQSGNQAGQINRTMRHYSNCPLFYLNVANQRPTSGAHHQHHHHHHANSSSGVIGMTSGGGGHQKASFYHIPNLFQNSFKVPLHFRNVYYYKSLLNLNMRLIVLRPHNAGAVTLRGGAGSGGVSGAAHHHHHHHPGGRPAHHHNHHHHYVPNTMAVLPNGHNVSLSCPDLNLKQVLIVKKPKREDQVDSAGNQISHPSGISSQTGAVPIASKPRSRKQIFDDECRVLNAGSIVLLPGSGTGLATGEKQVSNRSSRRESPTAGSGGERRVSLKLSDMSLSDFTDRIPDNEPNHPGILTITKKQRPHVDDIQEVDEESSSEESGETEESEDEEEDDENEECDNCLTRTKYGNYVYKYGYKPLARPLKFIYYSVIENIKLLKLIKFSIFAFCNFILSFFYEAPFYFINSYMIESGSTSNQAGTVTVAVGIVSVFSSIVYGYIGDSKKVNPIILYSVSLILCGLCCCLVPLFITNYLVTMILLIFIGALISVSDVLVPIICVNIVGYDDFVSAYGLMFFCQGLASFSGPPILGLIVDKSGGYALSFYIIGIGICLSGVVLESVLCYDKFTAKKKDFKKLDSSEKNLSIS